MSAMLRAARMSWESGVAASIPELAPIVVPLHIPGTSPRPRAPVDPPRPWWPSRPNSLKWLGVAGIGLRHIRRDGAVADSRRWRRVRRHHDFKDADRGQQNSDGEVERHPKGSAQQERARDGAETSERQTGTSENSSERQSAASTGAVAHRSAQEPSKKSSAAAQLDSSTDRRSARKPFRQRTAQPVTYRHEKYGYTVSK